MTSNRQMKECNLLMSVKTMKNFVISCRHSSKQDCKYVYWKKKKEERQYYITSLPFVVISCYPCLHNPPQPTVTVMAQKLPVPAERSSVSLPALPASQV